MERNIYKKGDIYWVDLGDNVKGSEQKGIRPCVIISNNIGNKFSTTLIISILSTQVQKAKLPTHVKLYKGEYNWITRDSFIALEQLRTIDKTRLGDYIGRIDCERFDKALEISLGLAKTECNNSFFKLAKEKAAEIEELNSCIKILLNRNKQSTMVDELIDEVNEKQMELDVYIQEHNLYGINYTLDYTDLFNGGENIRKMVG